ncbi:MAG: hypothetical protein ACP5IB_00160 [Thermoplasmata archaeon]
MKKDYFTGIYLYYNIILSIIFLISILTSNISNSAVLNNNFNDFPIYVIVLGALITIPGAIFLIGISLYSAYKMKRDKNALLYNTLISVGAIIFSIDGSMTFAGNYSYYYILLFLGLLFMFIGFVKSVSVKQE